MRKTEVYQVRLDSQEKKQAFAVFKQLGITLRKRYVFF